MELCSELKNWKPGRFYTVRTLPSAPLESDCYRSSSHSIREICIVLRGNSRYFFNNSVYPAAPGDIFLIDHWTVHGFNYQECDRDLVHLWLAFTRKKFTAVLIQTQEHGQFRRLDAPCMLPPEYERMVTNRWNLWNSNPAASAEEFLLVPLQSVLDEIIFQQMHAPEQEEEESPVEKVIEAIKYHILTNNARNCTMKQLEKLSGYSGSYLSHKFHELEHCTVGEWIDQVRIDYTVSAQKRGLKQKEIAFELGFSTPANFWLWLQKHQTAINLKTKDSSDKEEFQ